MKASTLSVKFRVLHVYQMEGRKLNEESLCKTRDSCLLLFSFCSSTNLTVNNNVGNYYYFIENKKYS